MKTKIYLIIIALLVNTIPAEEMPNAKPTLEKIGEFRKTQDDARLLSQFKLIEENKISPDESATLLCAILVETALYLSENEPPKEVPSINISPPDQGISGVDPAEIDDPKIKAAYQKIIDANGKLIEAHRKHKAILNLSDAAINLLAIYLVNGSIDESKVVAALGQYNATDAQMNSLRQLVKTAVANKAQHPTDGTPVPEKPKE